MEAYILDYKNNFLSWRSKNYAKQGWEYCLGSKKDTEHFAEDGAIVLPWNVNPSEDNYNNIKALRLVPNQNQLNKGVLPLFIKNLTHLDFLAMPLPLLNKIDDVPKTISSLMLLNSKNCHDILKKTDIHWPDTIFPNLQALQIFDLSGALEVNALSGLSPDKLPLLKLLECRINKIHQKLDIISNFDDLKFVALETVKNHNIFDYIKSPIKALSIFGTSNQFPIQDLIKLETIELLWLNDIRCEIDCSIFKSLPLLKEINFINSNKILSVNALLDCKKLESLEVINCKNPFGRKGKAAFFAHQYQRLEIDFA